MNTGPRSIHAQRACGELVRWTDLRQLWRNGWRQLTLDAQTSKAFDSQVAASSVGVLSEGTKRTRRKRLCLSVCGRYAWSRENLPR